MKNLTKISKLNEKLILDEDTQEVSLEEGKYGFVKEYKGYKIMNTPDCYVITDKNGKTITQTKWGLPVAEAIIDDIIEQNSNNISDESLKEDVEEEDDLLELEEPIDEEPIGDNTEEPTEPVTQEVADNAYLMQINDLIAGEYAKIDNVKSIIATFDSEDAIQNNSEVISILNAFIDETTISIGMLTKASGLIDSDASSLMQQGIDKAEEVIGDNTNKEEEVVEESLEEANANYVWKKCGDDWCLVVKGNEPKEDGNNLVELSRMNKYFPWTVYVKGKEKKNLDLPSDNINDIKKYIIDNIDKILGKKLKEAKVDYVKKDTYGKYGTEVTIYSCEGDENTKKGFTATVNGKALEADTLEELEKQIIDAVNSEDKKADNMILNDSLTEEDSKKKELPKGKMITNGKGISYYRQGNKYYSNTGWLEREISKEEFDREVEKAFKELDEEEVDESLKEDCEDIVFECHDFIVKKCKVNGKDDAYSLWLTDREKGFGKSYSPTTKYFKTIEDAKKYAVDYYGKDLDEE